MKTIQALTAVALAALAAASAHAQDGGVLNLICSVQDEWCTMMSTTFAKTSGIKVNMVKRSTGEALAQLIAEKSNPKTDIWFGGTGDPHMQAAELDLTLEYKSPMLPQLHPWAQAQAQQSGWRTVGVYSGPLGFGFNTELLAKKKMAAPKCWKDLLDGALKGEIQVANPNSSGTAYTMVATLVQLMGEDQAFEYMKSLHKNVSQYTRSGGVDQLRSRCAGRADAGLPHRHVHAVRRHGGRDRFDVDHQGLAQCRQGEEVLRMGAVARGAAVRRGRQAVPAAVEQGHAAGRPHSRFPQDQVHQLRLRQVRQVGRAQAPDRALGARRELAAALRRASRPTLPALT
jgi:hypothetical protein